MPGKDCDLCTIPRSLATGVLIATLLASSSSTVPALTAEEPDSCENVCGVVSKPARRAAVIYGSESSITVTPLTTV